MNKHTVVIIYGEKDFHFEFVRRDSSLFVNIFLSQNYIGGEIQHEKIYKNSCLSTYGAVNNYRITCLSSVICLFSANLEF